MVHSPLSRLFGGGVFISKSTLDDLLRAAFEMLLSSGLPTSPSRGSARELTGILLELTNPRARLSRTETKGSAFSCIGELLWYLSGSNSLKFIEYYIPRYKEETEDGATVYGGYGPRLFDLAGINQIQNVISLLTVSPYSRRAVIQIFAGADINRRRKEIPCTCTLQFIVRDDVLHLFVNMRSNDAYFGLPHDVFAFTMLQEIVARSLGIDIGTYKHFAGSLHIYEKYISDAEKFIGEGFQCYDLAMPEMPIGDPWNSIQRLLEIEAKLREKTPVNVAIQEIDSYWLDLARLLEVFAAGKSTDVLEMRRLALEMHDDIFSTYIDGRIEKASQSKKLQRQLPFGK
tara:strand:- start:2505 stop:3536 length:1032 start_codon:yes stop_codon:yes gene_type:complete